VAAHDRASASDHATFTADWQTESASARKLIDHHVLAKAFRGELMPQDPNNDPPQKHLWGRASEVPIPCL
jgi:hypothetical protein